jgi:two-component system invasion response regulator UvrY
MSVKNKIRVLLVDDHALVRAGVHRLLDDMSDIQVVAEAGSGEDALELAKQYNPAVIVMDAKMPGIGGLEATRRLFISMPETAVVILTTDVDEPIPSLMLEAGAAGCLTKDCTIEEIVAAIRAVSNKERYISADIARQMALSTLPGKEQSPFERLSQRELQVMMMVTDGQNVQFISDKLCLSPKTVSTYRYRLFDKLGVDNDVELTHLAIRHGLIENLVPV